MSVSGDYYFAHESQGPLRFDQEAVLCGPAGALAVHCGPHHLQEAESDECCHQGGHAAQLQARRRAVGPGGPGESCTGGWVGVGVCVDVTASEGVLVGVDGYVSMCVCVCT